MSGATAKAKPLRLLIAGGGAVVREFYLPALLRLGWLKGITVNDLSAEALQKLQADFPWIQTVDGRIQEVLARKEIHSAHDAIVVALPNTFHVEVVKAALEAGFPVLCEKPLAMTGDECSLLDRFATGKRQLLSVGMVRRLTPAAQAARRAIDSGILGEIRSVRVDFGGPYAWTSQSGEFFRKENGGILADLGVHHLDWIGSFLGPLIPVSYEDDWGGGIEASCRFGLRSRTGAEITVGLSHRYRRPNTVLITGDKGRLILDKENFSTCRLEGPIEGTEMDLKPVAPFVDSHWPRDFTSCFSQQFHNFSLAVSGCPSLMVSAEEAGHTMRLIEWAYGQRQPRVIVESRPEYHLDKGKTVVTGGTGFIGTALVERLAALGFEKITVPVRNYKTCASVARFPVDLPKIDLTNAASVRTQMKGARWVFHLAYGQTPEDARRITIDATETVVNEAIAAGAEAVVVLSTMYVFGHPETPGLVDESAPYQPAPGDYGQTKMEMEKWCLKRARSSGSTRIVVLNPSCVFGPEGKTYTRLPVEFARQKQFAWVDGGRGVGNYVYISNLIDAILLAAARPEAAGQRFIVNDGFCSWKEFVSPLLGPWADSIPSYSKEQFADFAKVHRTGLKDVVGGFLREPTLRNWVNEREWLKPAKEMARPLFRTRAPAPSGAIPVEPVITPISWLPDLFGPTTTRFSSARLKALGWESRVPLEAAQAATADWLRLNGYFER